ncbi:MAG TPA: hypothetical protein VF278_01565 [Pirellulales bacterium]
MANDDDSRYAALVGKFRELGCSDPDGWARSEIDEGVPQLARFVFLRELWNLVITHETSRKLNEYAGSNDDGRGGALRRLKECGINRNDLLTIVREAQIDVIHGVVSLLDELVEVHPDVQWSLYEVDEEFRPMRVIDGLHESIDDEDVMSKP